MATTNPNNNKQNPNNKQAEKAPKTARSLPGTTIGENLSQYTDENGIVHLCFDPSKRLRKSETGKTMIVSALPKFPQPKVKNGDADITLFGFKAYTKDGLK